ncbi:MAG: hypothetical protein ABSC19_01800 [Syntrophorhabdales bacterium]
MGGFDIDHRVGFSFPEKQHGPVRGSTAKMEGGRPYMAGREISLKLPGIKEFGRW